ncbi:MAG: DeoR/GlpR family DNA-binding transcription regulator [Lachnospiraceae bacterium]
MDILDMLQKQHKVEVNELAKKFGISDMTIRRDLNFLAKQYNITRTHGGALMANQSVVRMISFDESRISNKEAKEKIAAKAATLIKSGQRIFIDAGSTTRIILNYMSEDVRAVVVTNHLKVAEHALQFDNLSVIMLGGEMIRITNCSSGTVTEEQIKKYQLDIAFLGTAAIGTDGRLYDGYSPEARFKNSIFSVAKKIYLLADASKLNTYDLNEFGLLSQVDGVITDAMIDEEGMNLLRKYNTNIIIAE